ncbi:MAG TPA: ATP12 family protein [Hyphomicrobiales bacterium]|nr:ATP12 family protein [Hyphomicrobiales bacterium]
MALTPAQLFNRKRVYSTASAAAGHEGGGFEVQLDGRPLHTPKGAMLILPTRVLAEAIAEEWSRQGEQVNSVELLLTKLSNSAIDGVSCSQAQVVGDILSYAGTDLLCYRASYPPELAALQARLWDPILGFLRDNYGAHFLVCNGVRPIKQSQKSLESIKVEIAALNPFKLAAFHVMTSVTGSALLTLAHVKGFLDDTAAWAAAEADEQWQASHWGEDYEAKERQSRRFAEFKAASRLFNLS